MSSPTLVLYVCLHKCDNVFLFILSRTKGTFTRETERENQSCTISVDTRTPLCHFPLFGFGLLSTVFYLLTYNQLSCSSSRLTVTSCFFLFGKWFLSAAFFFRCTELNLRMYVQRLANGHAEHPPEFFYTGSLWKV